MTRSQDDQLIRACESCANRLRFTETVLSATQQQLTACQAIVAAKDEIISQQGGIITRYERLDQNHQRIGQIQPQIDALVREQRADDQAEIMRLRLELNRCRNPGFLTRLFNPDTLLTAGAFYFIGRATSPCGRDE